MKKELVRNSLDTLRSVREELHGNVDNIVIEQLDQTICNLETCLAGNSEQLFDALINLGKFLAFLPEIADLLQRLHK